MSKHGPCKIVLGESDRLVIKSDYLGTFYNYEKKLDIYLPIESIEREADYIPKFFKGQGSEPDTHILIHNGKRKSYTKYFATHLGTCKFTKYYWKALTFKDFTCCLAVLFQAVRLGAFPLNPKTRPSTIVYGDDFSLSGQVNTSFLPCSESIHACGMNKRV